MKKPAGQRGFTLIELLVVVATLALLVSILLPSLSAAKDLAKSAQCLSNLHHLGISAALYTTNAKEYYWAAREPDRPDGRVFFWGLARDPVDFRASPFMAYLDYSPKLLWCPSQPWGSYVPQSGGRGVNEPTTTYGYNGYCLDPPYWDREDQLGTDLPRKQTQDIENPAGLFVFADSALYWSPAGVPILQNSTSLDPVSFDSGPNRTGTTHFRHRRKANALCADGHAGSYEPENGTMTAPEYNIGLVGTANNPHYDQ